MKIDWREVSPIFYVVDATVDENSAKKSHEENNHYSNKIFDIK
jgi:hypothetical protein